MASSDSLLYFCGGIISNTGCDDTNGGGGKHFVAGVTVGKAPTNAERRSYMTDDGGPLAQTTNASYQYIAGFGIIIEAGKFSSDYVGLIAYIYHNSWSSPHWALILDASSDSISVLHVGESDEADSTTVRIGGAFATPQAMVNAASDADTENMLVHMFYNQSQNIASATFNLDADHADSPAEGDKSKNAWVILESFTSECGDRGRTKWTGNAANYRGANIDRIENFIWRYPHIYSASGNTFDAFSIGSTSSFNVIIEDGLADGYLDGFWTDYNSDATVLIGCEAQNADGGGFYLRGNGDVAYKCISHDNSGGFNTRGTDGRHCLISCLSYNNGSQAVKGRDTGNFCFVCDSTFDDNGDTDSKPGVESDEGYSTIIVVNSTVSNSNEQNLYANTGSLYAMNTNSYNPGLTDEFLAGYDNLEIDPQFDENYLPATWQLMESGIEDTGGNPTHIGAVGKPSAYDIIVAEES